MKKIIKMMLSHKGAVGINIIKISLLIVSILCFASLTVSANKAAVNVKNITMYVGDEKQLSVWENNVEWTVSKKNYVYLSKVGKIKALKKGKVTITAKHGNKKKKFVINIKNSFLKVNFSNVDKIQVRHLDYGYLAELDDEDIIKVKKLFDENVFFRYIPTQKPKAGGMKYNIIMYDRNAQIVYQIAVSQNEVGINGGGRYKAKTPPLDLSFFDSLFEDIK